MNLPGHRALLQHVGPPLWEAATTTAAAKQAQNDPQRDVSAESGPEIDFDQRIAW